MNLKKTPIVFSCDENYVLQTVVAINSMLKNGLKEQECNIFILTNGQISKEGLHLFDILNKYYQNCNLEVLTIDDNIFLDVKLEGWTSPSLYRLLLPEILVQYQRCVYLDDDILVLKDISELLDIDMNRAYLAGVEDKQVQRNGEHAKELGLCNLNGYINAGVMVMNLELMREQKKQEEFLTLVKNGYRFADQDVLNKSCYGQIKYLPREYNYFALFPERDSSIRILHFAGRPMDRPWLNERSKDAGVWWKYAELFKQSTIYKKIYQEVKQISKGRSFREVLACCQKYQKIIIWGYTKYGCELLNALSRNGIHHISGFVDSNLEKQKETYQGYRIYSPEILEQGKEYLVINAVQNRRDSINKALIRMKYRYENVFQFYIKIPEYYEALDEKYFDEEFREHILKEYGIRR